MRASILTLLFAASAFVAARPIPNIDADAAVAAEGVIAKLFVEVVVPVEEE